MQASHSEPYKLDPSCEIRVGIASWDDGTGTHKSIKFTWFDKNGKACRGGEVPIEAVPQMFSFGIRTAYLAI